MKPEIVWEYPPKSYRSEDGPVVREVYHRGREIGKPETMCGIIGAPEDLEANERR